MPTLILSFAPQTREAAAAETAPRKNLRGLGSVTAKLLCCGDYIRRRRLQCFKIGACRGQIESSGFSPRAKAKPAIPSSQDCVPAWRPGPVKTAPGLRAEEAVLAGGRYARRYRLREWQGNASR